MIEKKPKKAFLVIGSRRMTRAKLDPCFNRFSRHIRRLKAKAAELHILGYEDVLSEKLPDIASRTIVVVHFFPYDYWNKNIENYKKDDRIYGDLKFGEEFRRLFKDVHKKVKTRYRDKELTYINSIESSLLERDKKKAKSVLKRENIPTPRIFRVTKAGDAERLVENERALYIKPRFGSMGKGISYLTRDLLVTNFKLEDGRLGSRSGDKGWSFRKITDKNTRNNILKILILRGFIFEEAVQPPLVDGKRFDLRLYVIYGRIPYFYVKSTRAITPVTNWTQGGKIETKRNFNKYIPGDKLKLAASLALKATKALDLNCCGVDVIFSRDFSKAYVLEAHSFVSFERRFNLMKHMAEKILRGHGSMYRNRKA